MIYNLKYDKIESEWRLIIGHFFVKVGFIDFRFECTVWIWGLLFLFGLSFVNWHSFLFIFSEYFLTFRVDHRFESILAEESLIDLCSFTFKISFFMFVPVHHLIVVLLCWSDSLSFILLFYFIYVGLKFLFVFLILFLLTFLYYFLVLLLFLFLFLNYSVTSYVNWIITDLRYDCSGMRIYKWTVFDLFYLLFLKLLFFPLNLSLFLCLKLLNSVIKTWWFFQLSDWLLRRYFL